MKKNEDRTKELQKALEKNTAQLKRMDKQKKRQRDRGRER